MLKELRHKGVCGECWEPLDARRNCTNENCTGTTRPRMNIVYLTDGEVEKLHSFLEFYDLADNLMSKTKDQLVEIALRLGMSEPHQLKKIPLIREITKVVNSQ